MTSNSLYGPLADVSGDAGYQAHPERVGFFTDTSVCIGCKACEVACKEWNELPETAGGDVLAGPCQWRCQWRSCKTCAQGGTWRSWSDVSAGSETGEAGQRSHNPPVVGSSPCQAHPEVFTFHQAPYSRLGLIFRWQACWPEMILCLM